MTRLFFNFIKKNDPKGRLFNNKGEILKINETLTDENFLILKQLAKMKDESPWWIGEQPERFKLHDIADLLANTNESNIKYLEQLAKKSEKKYGAVETFKTDDILTVLKKINPQNDKVTGQLIEITGINDAGVLAECLGKVNKDNVDIYQLLLSTRKKGGPTELKIDEIQNLASRIEKTKNPKCAELFLNTEKSDGTGMFRHKAGDVAEMLDFTKDENVETYKKLYNLKSTADVENLTPLMRVVSEDNIDLVDRLLTKKYQCLTSEYVIFDDWSNIEKIMKSVNKENKSTASELLDIINGNRINRYSQNSSEHWGRGSRRTDDAFIDLLEEFNREPKKLKKAQQILAEGKVNGKQTLSMYEFFKKYDGYNESANWDF